MKLDVKTAIIGSGHRVNNKRRIFIAFICRMSWRAKLKCVRRLQSVWWRLKCSYSRYWLWWRIPSKESVNSALFFKESATLPSWNVKSGSLKIAVHCLIPYRLTPSFRKSSSSDVNFKTRRWWFLWMRKAWLGGVSFLRGVLLDSKICTAGSELESLNLELTSLSTSDPLTPCSFCRHSWAFTATSRDLCFW